MRFVLILSIPGFAVQLPAQASPEESARSWRKRTAHGKSGITTWT